MLPALLGKRRATQQFAGLACNMCSSLWWCQQLATEHNLATAAAVPAIVAAVAKPVVSLPLSIRPHRAPMVVHYPFEQPAYYSDRRTTLYNLDKQPLASLKLPGDIFNVPVRIDIMHQVVRWQRARARQGTHKTKDRSEVSGGGRKPWRQKGTGRARQGSIRAPQWRGGGIVHGPVPRSYAFALPKKVRRLGLKCALSAKANEGRLLVLDSLKPDVPKTKHMLAKLQKLLAGQPRISVLLVDGDKFGIDGGQLMRRAARNIPWVEIVLTAGANVYSILRRDVLIMTKPAVDQVVERLRRHINRLGAAGLAFQQRLQLHREQLQQQRKLQQQQ
eukprot:GHRR01022126.1.p1 GENE.GHRR01022126.1~~GHRR01022126.1.p1  ORF type:complete len:332 (+),score=63.83 GHRR01022126.1:117-1112(+)